MVRLQLPMFCILILVLSMGVLTVEAQNLVYHLEHEWVNIWINEDGTIDLLYDVTIVCDEGVLHWIEIGQPNYDFKIGQAFDENNNELDAVDSSYQGDYKVQVDVEDLNAGKSVRFNLTTNVGHMIWKDTQNLGNVGMQFTPTWFPVRIDNLRVRIVTPSGVTESNLKTITGAEWDNADYEDGNFAVYWERHNLAPSQKYTFGVSFPEEFVQHYEVQKDFLQTYGPWIAVLIVLFLVVVLVAVALRKKPYLKPIMSMEALGIRRGLTAVEASYLLDLMPNMIVTEILYSLLKKRAVWVTATKPSVMLKVMKPFKSEKPGELAEVQLRYYEIDFLNAIKKDGTLDEELLAETILFLQRSIEEKLRGYCRRDTINYYRKIVEKAWRQVEQAGTSELASKAYDEQLLWLLLDPQHRAKTETTFKNRVFEPAPFWFWYWYGYQQYHPRPTYKPNIDAPTEAKPPPKIPGADFANNIATAVENTSNSIVANLEKFANAIIPAAPPPRTSHKPAHRSSSCVCACAACACACACVSCACACAGGGAG
ncbi:MAG: hypothetical protein OEY24_00935 [Candidatus Bathyarchaeota archaeon]|nr:hypothetical protein [Candidatus Bathyarchaeota archaeon]MDH5494259.1 hypothetical protein [Candidatus Bathyarchaeota archaeon]